MRQLTILMAALLCLLVPLAALAEDAAPAERVDYSDIDLSGATLEELRELRDRIDRQIESMETVEDKRYESGTYAVGIDIPVGTYLVLEEERGIFPSVTIRRGPEATSELLGYELIVNQAVLQLTAGTYLTLNDAVAYPFDRAPAISFEDGVGEEGGYWVGVQIPAGRYRIVPDDKAPLSNFSVYSGVVGTNPQTLRFELIYEPVELDLETGQYVVLSGCTLQAE